MTLCPRPPPLEPALDPPLPTDLTWVAAHLRVRVHVEVGGHDGRVALDLRPGRDQRRRAVRLGEEGVNRDQREVEEVSSEESEGSDRCQVVQKSVR